MRKVIFLLIVICLLVPQPVLAATDIIRTGDITIAAGERVMGEVVSLRGDVDIHGEVFGDIVALLGNVTVHSGGVVHGDVICLSGAIDLQSGAKVSGDQVSLGGVSKVFSLPQFRSVFDLNLGRRAFNSAVRVLLAGLLGLFFPKALARMLDQVQTHFGPTLGVGVLTWMAALPLALISALTIIGIPLSLLVLLGLWAAYYFGFATISGLVGGRILPSHHNGLGSLALGALMLSTLVAVPFLGLLIRIAVAMAGVGAAVLTRFGTRDGA